MMGRRITYAAATTTLQSADIIETFLKHMVVIGAEGVLVVDLGSSDGTQDLISSAHWKGFAHLIQAPNYAADDSSNWLLAEARKRRIAPWCLFCDPDEFPDRAIEHLEPGPDISLLPLPRLNVTARRSALAEDNTAGWDSLRLEIARPVRRERTEFRARHLSPPWIFGAIKPKILVRADHTIAIASGDHSASLSEGTTSKDPGPVLHHYPLRSFASFEDKIATAEGYLAANPQFGEDWGWHWRRWIRLRHKGALLQEFLAQFPDDDDTGRLLAGGTLRSIAPVGGA